MALFLPWSKWEEQKVTSGNCHYPTIDGGIKQLYPPRVIYHTTVTESYSWWRWSRKGRELLQTVVFYCVYILHNKAATDSCAHHVFVYHTTVTEFWKWWTAAVLWAVVSAVYLWHKSATFGSGTSTHAYLPHNTVAFDSFTHHALIYVVKDHIRRQLCSSGMYQPHSRVASDRDVCVNTGCVRRGLGCLYCAGPKVGSEDTNHVAAQIYVRHNHSRPGIWK